MVNGAHIGRKEVFLMHLPIPVYRIKNMALRRLVVALSLPLVIAFRLVVFPIGMVTAFGECLWICGKDLIEVVRGAIAVCRTPKPKAVKAHRRVAQSVKELF